MLATVLGLLMFQLISLVASMHGVQFNNCLPYVTKSYSQLNSKTVTNLPPPPPPSFLLRMLPIFGLRTKAAKYLFVF